MVKLAKIIKYHLNINLDFKIIWVYFLIQLNLIIIDANFIFIFKKFHYFLFYFSIYSIYALIINYYNFFDLFFIKFLSTKTLLSQLSF